MPIRHLLLALSLTLLIGPAAVGKSEPASLPATPAIIATTVRDLLPKVWPASVAIEIGGSASGVVISPDGWVLTAGHVLMNKPVDTEATILFPDGTEAKARSKGHDLDYDFGLLKIDGDRRDWPHVTMAAESVSVGGFVFTLAHPSGHLKGRPAQARIGRVTSTRQRDEKPWFMMADLEIQPGDSGGPLFNLEGKLVGLDSSAGSIPGFNRFPAIERLGEIRERLEKGEQWGDFNNGPGNNSHSELGISPDVVEQLTQLLGKRFKEGHRPTVRFVLSKTNEKGEAEIDSGALVNFLAEPALSLSAGSETGYGLDDPALVAKLPKLPDTAAGPLALMAGKRKIGHAVHIAPGEFLAKASLLPDEKAGLRIRAGKKVVEIKVMAVDEDYDLALLHSNEPVGLPHVTFPETMPEIVAATPLMGRDGRGLVVWNIATDQARPVTKKRSVGPLTDKSLISKHRAPYPIAIRHALPLYAEDAATPVYDLEGRFIGIHMARFSRTMGLIIPADVLEKRLEILRQSPD